MCPACLATMTQMIVGGTSTGGVALLVKEKASTRERDVLTTERRNLPMVTIEKEYVFEGPNGRTSLRDLFDGRRQLIIYHFMFDPGWDEGCKSCSHFLNTYNFLDVTPLGRQEEDGRIQAWIRHHDKYPASPKSV